MRPPDPRADPLRGPPRALVRVPPAVCGRGLKSYSKALSGSPLYVCIAKLIPHHKQVVPTDRYCSFRCAAGYEPTPQAAFDERARVGSAVTFEGGQGASQTLDLGGAAVMKQVLPLGEGLLFFVSNANQVSAAFSNALFWPPFSWLMPHLGSSSGCRGETRRGSGARRSRWIRTASRTPPTPKR